ncbi:MAG: hypothetical protein K6T75_04550 [Acetobacteraceae bacterium]|nr:hypothetical protein [Acetobacteraceae bacterium]
MKTYSRLQIDNLLKAIVLMLFLFTVAWSIVSLLALGDIWIGRPILLANVVLSLVVGWFFYRSRYHEQFSYDLERLEYRRGAYHSSRRWEEFERVSLVHVGRGQFAVRLYPAAERGGGPVEIPASRLGLDPSGFRFEAMRLVAAARAGAASEATGDEEEGQDEGPAEGGDDAG